MQRLRLIVLPNQDKVKQLTHQQARKLFEPPRILRRLNSLRGLSHEQVEQVFTGGPRAGCADGAGAPRGVPVAVGGY